MFTRPTDLADEAVAAFVEAGWAIDVDAVEHVARGFGGHHWRVASDRSDWFVTVDELGSMPLALLAGALGTARWLREVGGLDWVVAPVPSAGGRVVELLDDRWGVSVHPWVEGRAHDWGPYPDRASRLAVVDRLVELHGVDVDADRAGFDVPVDDLAVVGRDDVFAGIDRSWVDAGPHGEPVRQRLIDAEPALRRAFDRYDRLVDAVRVGLPERDLWMLAREDPAVLDEYEARTGRAPAADALELCRLRWDLTDVCLLAPTFRLPHAADADTAIAWPAFQHALTVLAS